MNFKAKVISPLEKVFYDEKITKFKKYPKSSALIGEKHNFIVAFTNDEFQNLRYCLDSCFYRITSDIKENIKVYSVEHVPAVYASHISETHDNYLRQYPGLFPDILVPIDETTEFPLNNKLLFSLWIEIDTANVTPGKHDITISFTDSDKNIYASCTHSLKVINAQLPEQELIVTHWLHTDCIADYYKIGVFSDKYWTALKNYIKTYVEAGNNMIYTPLFTPPLDTVVGGERTTVQLVDVSLNDGKYEFGFEKFRKWVGICKECGVKYYEMSHLFTQWGAFHAPKIIASVNGKNKKIFGWDTDSHGKEYEDFLAAFLPCLMRELCDNGINEYSYFHISDEPQIDHLESYKACSDIIRKYLKGYKIMDAMANIEFYNEKLVDIPIPYISHSGMFFEKNIKPRFVYYCGVDTGMMGRSLSMPSSRNRISGTNFYISEVDGFLHWGYNFYNTARSLRKINPYYVTDAGRRFCAGDSYVVYPAEDLTSYKSIRLAVFRDGLQDMRAMQLCETLYGRDAVLEVLSECNNGKLPELLKVPDDPEYTIKVREKLNALIEKSVK